MTIDVLIPTYDHHAATFQPAPRVTDLEGSTVGIISNGKHGTVAFFDAIPHPISSAGPEALTDAARTATAACVELLTRQVPAHPKVQT